jgi:hypothetical protein
MFVGTKNFWAYSRGVPNLSGIIGFYPFSVIKYIIPNKKSPSAFDEGDLRLTR